MGSGSWNVTGCGTERPFPAPLTHIPPGGNALVRTQTRLRSSADARDITNAARSYQLLRANFRFSCCEMARDERELHVGLGPLAVQRRITKISGVFSGHRHEEMEKG